MRQSLRDRGFFFNWLLINIYHLPSLHSRKCLHPYKECVCFLQVYAPQHHLPDREVGPLFGIKAPECSKSSLWGGVLPPAPRSWALGRLHVHQNSPLTGWAMTSSGTVFLSPPGSPPSPYIHTPPPPCHTHKGALGHSTWKFLKIERRISFLWLRN